MNRAVTECLEVTLPFWDMNCQRQGNNDECVWISVSTDKALDIGKANKKGNLVGHEGKLFEDITLVVSGVLYRCFSCSRAPDTFLPSLLKLQVVSSPLSCYIYIPIILLPARPIYWTFLLPFYWIHNADLLLHLSHTPIHSPPDFSTLPTVLSQSYFY